MHALVVVLAMLAGVQKGSKLYIKGEGVSMTANADGTGKKTPLKSGDEVIWQGPHDKNKSMHAVDFMGQVGFVPMANLTPNRPGSASREAWQPYDGTATPADADLQGPFVFELRGGGYPTFEKDDCRIWDDTKGAQIKREAADRVLTGRLSADQTRTLVEGLKRLKFWALVDALPTGLKDGVFYTLSLKAGQVQRSFTVHSDCPGGRSFAAMDAFAEATERVPADAGGTRTVQLKIRDVPECPQMQVINMLTAACKGATEKRAGSP